MAELYAPAFVAALRDGLAGTLAAWGLPGDTDVRLLNLSENATFLAQAPGRASLVFRVYRPGYHRREEIASELTWIAALRAAGTVETPAIVPCTDGTRIVQFQQGRAMRHVVAFAFMSGAEPDPDSDLMAGFGTLGALSARLHAHARVWVPPAGFTRKTWDWAAAFGPAPLWGDWRAALALDAPGRAVLERLAKTLQARCAGFGQDPVRFGLIHADLRLANLLVEGPRMGVIDFDDCGYSWFMYDFAAAISFLEGQADISDLLAAWLAGYRAEAPLGATEAAIIPDLILFRRLLLTAWIASHAETETARWAGHGAYTAGTVELAERYLSGGLDAWRRI